MLFDNLRRLVDLSGKSQKYIAIELGLSQQRFNAYVSGKRTPDPDMICTIADYFGVSSDYLLGRTDEKRPTPVSESEPSEKERLVYDRLSKLTPENLDIALAQLDVLLEHQEKRDNS